MLTKLIIELDSEKINTNMGSLFHGFLMGFIKPEYADYFHHNDINPYTSCIYKDKNKNKWIWRITTYSENAYKMIVEPLIDSKIEEIELTHKDLIVPISSMDLHKTTISELYLSTNKSQRLNFITPTSFKSNGRTHIFPNIRSLLMGVVNKINKYSTSFKLEDEEVLNNFFDNIYINNYNLRTERFSLERIKIKGFKGWIDINTRDKEFRDLLVFLVLVSEYTGIGIKTALGMGGVQSGKYR